MKHIIILACLLVGCASPNQPSASRPATTPQTPAVAKTNPADVGTIVDIVRVSYEVINGPAGGPRQWERDRTLYMPGATFVSVFESHGRIQSKIMTPEEYRIGFKIDEASYETEIGRLIERYGQVAQVRSVAEVRTTPGGPVRERYVNYFQLYSDGTRWWIAGMVWDTERPSTPIPEAWIGKWEEVTR